MEVEAELGLPGGITGKLELRSRVPISRFTPCQGQLVTEWSHRKMRNEKYLVHQDFVGRFTRKKLSDLSDETEITPSGTQH